MYAKSNLKKDNNDNNWNSSCAESNLKKDNNNEKVAIDDNINKNKFMIYMISHVLENLF